MTDDDDDRPRAHWGDFGALILAGGFSLFGLYLATDMLLGGHPLAPLFQTTPAPRASAGAPAQPASSGPMQLAPGEVQIDMAAQPKKPPPKP